MNKKSKNGTASVILGSEYKRREKDEGTSTRSKAG